MRNPSLSVHFARAVLKNTVDHGLDPIALLRKNRISPRLLLEDDARLSAERFADLQVSTMLAMQDENLGYGARRAPIGCWSMMCHAVIGSSTLGQALSRYCRFYQLFESGFRPILVSDADTTSLHLDEPGTDNPQGAYYSELFLTNSQRFCNWLVQQQLPLLGVNLKYPPIAREDEYRQIFMGNPVQFNQGVASLTFTSAQLEQPLKQNESSLRHFLRHPVLLMLTQHFDGDSWTARVRDHLRRNMEQLPELSEVARLLEDRKSTRLNSSHDQISYAVFCLKKKKK